MKHTKQQPSQSLALHAHTVRQLLPATAKPAHSHKRHLPRQFKTTLIGVAVALVLGHSPQARATTITVNTTDPAINADTQCSLIEAINNANDDAATHADCPAGSRADTVILSGNTYSLLVADNSVYGETGLPLITSTITIQGNGAIIERAAASTEDFRLFYITSGDLTLEKTTISGGKQPGGIGGGLFNAGSLTLTNSTVSGNTANIGGGVQNYGTAILTNSTVSGNTAFYGGGVGHDFGTISLTNSTVSGNTATAGGGFYSNGNNATLTNSTVTDKYPSRIILTFLRGIFYSIQGVKIGA